MFDWAGIDLLTRLWWRLWGEPVDLAGVLRTDHELRFLGLCAVSLHDRLERRR